VFFSTSHEHLVLQSSLVPIVRQLDACQSEAVVGSSSDIASPSRSRLPFCDVDDRCSPDSSPELDADSQVPSKRPVPRGLVDALSRYFTPSDKRRSRVSLNALPHASPRSLVAFHSFTSAADTTQAADSAVAHLPPKRRYRKKLGGWSESDRFGLWKRGSSAGEKVSSPVGGTSDTGDVKPAGCDSPTSQLSPSTSVPPESKPSDTNRPLGHGELDCTEIPSSERRPKVATAASADAAAKKSRKKATTARKRRQTQLSLLHDSLSHFFSAEGDRKRTPAQYADSEFTFEVYRPFENSAKLRKRQRSLESESWSVLRHDQQQPEILDSAVGASWPSPSYRLSNYYLAGNALHCVSKNAPLPMFLITRQK